MSENRNDSVRKTQGGPPPGRGMGPGARFARPVEKPKNVKNALKRLLKYCASSKLLLISLIAAVIISTAASLYTNILIKDIVAALGTYDSENGVWITIPDEKSFWLSFFLAIATYVGYCIMTYLSSLLAAYLSNRTVRKMRNDLFNKIVHLPISYIDSHAHGDLLSRMTNDVDNISQAVSQSVTSLISGVLTILGCIAIMVYYSPLLTLCSLVVILMTMFVLKFTNKYARPLFKKQQAVLGKLNTVTEETVTGNKTVLTNNRQYMAIEEFNGYSDEFSKTATKAQILGSMMGPIMNFVGNVGYFLTCICGALFILKGIGKTITGEPLTIAIVIMFLTTSKQFTRPINEIAQLYTSLITALAGAERVFTILDEKEETFEGEIPFEVEEVNGKLDFENVVFGYNEEKTVLKDFNLHVEPGYKIALVGATGSGKTTIVNLLLRFYDINSGKISIDGKDISKISKRDLRDSISIVLQDPILFGDTIENNVRYGKSDASDEEVDEALKFANCTSFVNRLENGKKTILNEGATNISQGQRQLLTIARAVLADPKILILDEATSSVDTRTEKKIQDAMQRLMSNRTSVIIAHRLSTIQDANLIVVLDNGHVVEKGTHKELLDIDGVYKNLYDTQFKGLST